MKIIHFAPFAPNGCGLYEAARDMYVADQRSGHEVHFIDTGTIVNDVHTPGTPGKEDARGGTTLTTVDPSEALNANLLIAHTGVPDPWIAPNQAPILWILHGRPAACFKPEQFNKGASYTLMRNLAQWPRVKKLISFWPYHTKFWKPIIPDSKLYTLSAPPIDEARFSSIGPTHDYTIMGGKYNIMLAESWREDVDIYEIAHGVIELAKQRNDVKFHFYAMETPLRCWEFILQELRSLNALGEVWARRPNMEEVYRAADILLSPQRIATRTVGEAVSCGTPVVAMSGCVGASETMKPSEPESVANALNRLIYRLKTNPDLVNQEVTNLSQQFKLDRYSYYMNDLYKQVTTT
jgi:glycosyltransferase involved in cell wall biosynthesis